jgi:hypothetical protein
MRSWLSLLLSALGALAWAGAPRAMPPERVELAYEIARNGLTIAEVAYVLEHDTRTYRITETTKGRGILALRGTIRRTSRGMISPQGLKPQEFVDERTGRSSARALFDWDKKIMTQQYKGEPRTEPLPARAHDRLAFIFDFAFAARPAGEVAFNLFNGRGQSHHVYTAGPRGRVKTPLGELDALSFVRGSGDERTELWLAADSLLPVRIVVTAQDGTRYDQLATKISPP